MSAALFMLDTNTASFSMRDASAPLRRRMSKVPLSSQAISVITEAELRFGVAKSRDPERYGLIVGGFLAHVQVLPWSSEAAAEYGMLRFALEKADRPLGNMDLLIAAHAKAVGAVLVTNDAALLRLPPLLKVVDWTAAEV